MPSPNPFHCPIVPVRELHGRTPKSWLSATVASSEAARPGDVVALRQPGCMLDSGLSIGATLHIVKSASGFCEERLYDLPSHRVPALAQCAAALDDDWEILGEFPDEFLEPGETGPARLELIHCPGALMFIWLDKPRAFGMPPSLLASTPQPAALFIEETDLAHADARHQRRLQAQIDLCERLSGVPILHPAPA